MKRFWNKVESISFHPCLEWLAAKDKAGYGRFNFRGTNWKASRVMWVLEKGEISEGLHILHKCDNPGCVRIEHLFLGSHMDNIRDKMHKNRHQGPKKTHCPQGHEYGGKNLWISKRNGRTCLICASARAMKSRANKILTNSAV